MPVPVFRPGKQHRDHREGQGRKEGQHLRVGHPDGPGRWICFTGRSIAVAMRTGERGGTVLLRQGSEKTGGGKELPPSRIIPTGYRGLRAPMRCERLHCT